MQIILSRNVNNFLFCFVKIKLTMQDLSTKSTTYLAKVMNQCIIFKT